MTKKEGKAIIFSAPSGAGKTTIVRAVISKIPGMEFSISATTRSPRANEVHGVDYYFLSEHEFQLSIVQEKFLEWEQVYDGVYYGTLKSEVQRIWSHGGIAIFDVDVEGGISIKSQLKDNALSVFIKVANENVLRERLMRRKTENENDLAERLNKSFTEMKKESSFDRSILNDDLNAAIEETKSIISDFLDTGK